MKFCAPLLCSGLLATAASAVNATDVGVSVQISQPGVYGRVDIGRFPQPQVIVAQPVVVAPPPWGGAAGAARVRVGAAGPPQALEQALPRIQRLRRAGVLRAP